MRPETYIARRLYYGNTSSHAKPAVRVALIGMIIGVLVMVVTISVVVGFKRTIVSKITGFGAHIQVLSFESNNTYEFEPIHVPDSLLTAIRAIEHVTEVNTFVTKPGIVKTDSAFQGVVFKGTDYWEWFANNLLRGELPKTAESIMISARLGRMMRLDVDSTLLCYFVGDEVRVRKFRVSGVYETGLGEFDERFILGAISVVQRLNAWDEDEVSGIEILIDDFRYLDEARDNVYFATANRFDEESGQALHTRDLVDQNYQIFAWLDLLNTNVWVILLLMLAVSGFNIISGLIIMLLDNIQMIGLLKSLGADNRFIRRIFITDACMLVLKGMFWGNVLAIALCAVQYFTHILPLDAATYYVSSVPVSFPWGWLLLLNIGILVVSFLVLLAPSAIVTRISPARVMHFE